MTTRQQAADALVAAIRKADSAIYNLRAREHSMRPREFKDAMHQARNNAADSIRTARKALDAATARERHETFRESQPNAEWAARRTLYATQAMALAQAGMNDLAAGVRAHLAAGNQVAAREYLQAGGTALREHLNGGLAGGSEYRTLQRAAADTSTAKQTAHRAGIDMYAQQLARLDLHLDRVLNGGLGEGSLDPGPDAVRQDPARVVELWHTSAEQSAIDAALTEATAHQQAAAETGVTAP